MCNFLALRYLQLDEAIAIIFSTPFFVAALSGPMLGEWVRWRRWTAIGVGFIGVLVVARPGAGAFQPATVSLALATRLIPIDSCRLARNHFERDHARRTSRPFVLLGVVLDFRGWSLAPTTSTDPLVIASMVASGAMGSFGHYLLIAAHRWVLAAGLSPFIYTEDFEAIILGDPGVRRRAEPLDLAGLRHRGGLGPLHPASRAQAKGDFDRSR